MLPYVWRARSMSDSPPGRTSRSVWRSRCSCGRPVAGATCPSSRSSNVAAARGARRAAGLHDVSLDWILGRPDALERDWARDLEQALALLPAHLSLYGLTEEERTPLARWIPRGAASPPTDHLYADEYLL